jgi:diguanylate cyclase (GGDEF)-like protein
LSDRTRAPREVLGEEAFRHLIAWEADRATRYQDFFSVCLVKPDARDPGAHDIQRAIATKIGEFLRSTDVVAEIQDGAGFLLLHTASADAVRVAERIRTNIENVAFPGPPGAPPRRITLSVGEVSFPNDGSNDRTLLSRAEASMHEAARRGGNRTVTADDLPRSS